MKKNLLLSAAIFIASSFISVANAQLLSAGKSTPVKNIFKGASSFLSGTTCDTSNTDGSILQLYTFNGSSGVAGFITGENSYWHQVAGYYDLSATTDTYINGVLLYFGIANSSKAGDLTRVVNIDVYDNNGGVPGNLLYTTPKTIAELQTDVNANQLTNISISPGVALPSDKTFFVLVDFSNLTWSTLTKDSVALVSDSSFTQGQAYVNYPAGSWSTTDQVFTNLNLGLAVLPITSGATTCTGLLPLQLVSFNIQKESKNTVLNWTVANEANMQDYEIQRAGSNLNFTTLQSVNASNAVASHSYSYTDLNALASLSGNIYYRLKQVNKDGSSTYSKIISVNAASNGTQVIFTPNPFTSTLSMQINMQNTATATIRIYDMQGRFTGLESQSVLNAGNQSLSIPGSANLRPGTYFVDVNTGDENLHYKVVKQ